MDPTGVILLTVLVAIAIAAPRYGVDSRLPPPGEPPPPPHHPPTLIGDLAALARGVRQACGVALHTDWPWARTSSGWPSSSRRSAR